MVKPEPAVVLMLVVGIPAVFAGLGYLIYRLVKKQESETKRLRTELGFQEEPERVEALIERMKTFYPGWDRFDRLENPYYKSELGYELHLFDLSFGKSPTRYDQALMISPDLKLPPFSMFPIPKVEGPGLLASMANKYLTWQPGMRTKKAEFPDSPEFDAKYLVRGDDEAALHVHFNAGRLSRLAEMSELELAGNADGLLFTQRLLPSRSPLDLEGMQQLLEDARILHDVLKG